MKQGDVFDKGNGEYEEYIETRENIDLTIIYTREKKPPYNPLKIITETEKAYLETHYRQIGKREKNKLIYIFANAKIIYPDE